MTHSHLAVEAQALTRSFTVKGKPDRVALESLDICVEPGEVHGLLGPNGAGKTTLCKILSTVLLPTSGEARIHGYDVVTEAKSVRPLIGIVFGGEKGLYARMSPRRNLRFWAALYGLRRREAHQRTESLLERVGLTQRGDDPVETFSRGMKQRLHLARGLIGDPKVVILDEPTVGMDPVSAHEFRDLVEQLRAEHKAVLLTTHDMAEAEALCDQVSFIDNGRLVTRESPRSLGQMLSRFERVRAGGVNADLAAQVEALPGVAQVRRPGNDVLIAETSEDGASHRVLRALIDAGISDISTDSPSLEEVYLHLIGDRGMQVAQ
ncbi:ABC transporter ATP-binding protein [Natronoglycomyces albus]|uniref:ABC transporter ATP-binding protein n=1 Tax=Natronoglycomyces albus TaxID=2811108 RepID=A0A895XK91_9ACTN|nr:ABC transporter ATP-binding protein [Natronoglycomyces albus]QSB03973.1 ABC transporter ATP-binding protein [Natronoglycomyces albus]